MGSCETFADAIECEKLEKLPGIRSGDYDGGVGAQKEVSSRGQCKSAPRLGSNTFLKLDMNLFLKIFEIVMTISKIFKTSSCLVSEMFSTLSEALTCTAPGLMITL